MMSFGMFVNLIEAFIFPIFISYYFKINGKTKFIIFSGFIQFFLLSIFSLFLESDAFLTLVIIIVNIISVYIKTKEITFNNTFIIILYNLLIIISSTLGLYISSFFKEMSVIEQYGVQGTYIIACLIAKVILIVCTFIIIYFQINLSVSFKKKGWNLVLLFEVILMITTVIVLYQIISMKSQSNDLYYLLSLFLMLLNFIFMFIIYRLNQLNLKNLDYERKEQSRKFDYKKMNAIKNIKNEIDAIDHRLFYVIFEIDNLLNKKDFDKIQCLLDEYKNIVLKHKMVFDTSNSIFDCLISLKINDMVIKGIDVKTCIFISEKNIYNNLSLINFINNTLSYFYECKRIEINIKEINGFLSLAVLYDGDFSNKNQLIKFLEKEIQEINGYYNIDNFEQTGLKISIKIGD